MKDKIFQIFSSNILVEIKGKNIQNFIKRLIRGNINIIRVIPVSYKEVRIIINYNDLDKIIKYNRIYDIKIIKYYGKLKIIRFIKKNIYIFISLIISLIIIYILSHIIFSVEVIHSNSNIIKLIKEELEDWGIKKYNFVKSYDEVEKIENEIIENNKDKIEWLEITRSGTKYIVRVEERIINKERKDNKIYNIVSAKNAIIKEIYAEDGEKVRSINSYVKKDDIIISSSITLPNNEIKVISSKGKVIGEVWYNVSIDMPFHYHEVSYTGKKRNVLVFNLINNEIPFFNFHEYKTFNKNIKMIFNNNIIPISLYYEYQYETNIIDKIYNEEEIKEVAIQKVKDKLKESNNKIQDFSKILIMSENTSNKKISLNLFVSVIEDITKYSEVILEDNTLN